MFNNMCLICKIKNVIYPLCLENNYWTISFHKIWNPHCTIITTNITPSFLPSQWHCSVLVSPTPYSDSQRGVRLHAGCVCQPAQSFLAFFVGPFTVHSTKRIFKYLYEYFSLKNIKLEDLFSKTNSHSCFSHFVLTAVSPTCFLQLFLTLFAYITCLHSVLTEVSHPCFSQLFITLVSHSCFSRLFLTAVYHACFSQLFLMLVSHCCFSRLFHSTVSQVYFLQLLLTTVLTATVHLHYINNYFFFSFVFIVL